MPDTQFSPISVAPLFLKIGMLCLILLLGKTSWGQTDFRTHLDRVDSLLEEEAFDLAIERCKAIAAEAREEKSWEAFFEAYYSIGYALHYQQKIPDFLQYEEELIPFLAVNDPGVLDMLLLLGNAHRNNEDIYEADRYYSKTIQRIRTSFPEARDSWLDANINKGVVLIQLSDFEEARIYLNRVLNYVDSLLLGDPQDYYIGVKSNIHGDLAQVYRYLEEKEACLFHYEERIATLQQINARRLSQVRSLLNMAEALIFFDEVDQARSILEEILTEDLPYSFERGRAFRFLAEIYVREEKFVQANQALDSAEACYEAFPQRLRFRARLSQLRGEALMAENARPQEALESFQKALDLYIKNFHPQSLTDLPNAPNLDNGRSVFDCLIHKAEAWQKKYQAEGQTSSLEEAYRTYKKAVEIMDQLRSDLKNRQSKYFWGESLHQALENGIRLCLQLQELTQSDEWAERAYEFSMAGKAFTLKEKLREYYLFRQDQRTDSLLNIEVSLARKMGKIQLEIEEVDDPEQKREKENQLFEIRQLYQANRQEMKASIPSTSKAFASASTQRTDEVQQSLGRDHQIWEYFWGDQGAFAFAVDQDQVHVRQLPEGEALLGLLDTFVHRLSDPQWIQENAFSPAGKKAYAQAAYNLYQAIKPNQESKARLLIVPDGPLTQIPFGCLLTLPQEEEVGYEEFPFLIHAHEISYSYAVHIQGQPGRQVSRQPYLGFAPSYESALPSSWTRGLASRGSFGPLTYNKEEVENARETLGGKGVFDQQANKMNFLGISLPPQILHLALHAFVNDSLPLYSGLAFHQGNGAQSDSEGILFAYEIPQLNLATDLTILSACQTGKGRYRKGEGVLSLARSFMEGGSKSVLMTQWSIDDQATSVLVNAFLSKLKQGLAKDVALQQAKREFLTSFDRNHPFYWGGMVLVGEEEAIFSKGENSLALVFVGMLVLGLLIFWVNRRRN